MFVQRRLCRLRRQKPPRKPGQAASWACSSCTEYTSSLSRYFMPRQPPRHQNGGEGGHAGQQRRGTDRARIGNRVAASSSTVLMTMTISLFLIMSTMCGGLRSPLFTTVPQARQPGNRGWCPWWPPVQSPGPPLAGDVHRARLVVVLHREEHLARVAAQLVPGAQLPFT